MNQMGFAELFFSAQGRAPRLPSLLAAGLLLFLAALYETTVTPTLHWITGWFVYPALFYPGACVLSKRRHDRGRSGRWAALNRGPAVAVCGRGVVPRVRWTSAKAEPDDACHALARTGGGEGVRHSFRGGTRAANHGPRRVLRTR